MGSTPSKRRCWQTRWGPRYWLCSRRSPQQSGSRSCCTTCSRYPSKRSHPSWDAPRRQRGSSRAAHSRARRRVRGAAPAPDADLTRQREVVDAFLAAARGGDFEALVAVLDPGVVLRADRAAVDVVASREVRGAPAVARMAAKGRARAARPALVNGAVGVVVAPRGRLLMVLGFTLRGSKIVGIDAIADPARLGLLDLVVLDG